MPSMTIRLPEEKLRRLRQAAASRKKSANALVEEAIDAFLPPAPAPMLSEVLKDYIGSIDGPPTDSSKIGEVFADILVEKHREGHL